MVGATSGSRDISLPNNMTKPSNDTWLMETIVHLSTVQLGKSVRLELRLTEHCDKPDYAVSYLVVEDVRFWLSALRLPAEIANGDGSYEVEVTARELQVLGFPANLVG